MSLDDASVSMNMWDVKVSSRESGLGDGMTDNVATESNEACKWRLSVHTVQLIPCRP